MIVSQDVQWLLEDKYGWTRQASIEAAERYVADDFFPNFSDEILTDIKQLQVGVPLAYLIGWVAFLGCRIDLRYRPLIPRPETEFWVGEFLRRREVSGARPARVLDLCSGSGCISVAIAKVWPEVDLVAADIDPEAVKQTTLNLTQLVLKNANWKVVQSDLFTKISGDFDVILSNPPYVDRAGEFQESVKHEPDQAVFADEQGMAVIRRIISQVDEYLRPDGELWLEFAAEQGEGVKQLAEAAGFVAVIKQDHYGRDRFAIITRSTLRPQN